MNVLIIEDEIPAVQRLSKMMLNANSEIKIIAVLDSIETSVKWLKENPAPDLIMMDIHLADGSSFEIFNHISVTSPIIFTTAYNEHALKAFEVNSIDYLLKPVKSEHLDRALAKLHNFTKDSSSENSIKEMIKLLNTPNVYKTRFRVNLSDKIMTIEEADIAYFQSEGKIVFLVSKENKKFVLDFTLEELEKSLNPKEFFRLNRQFIVKLSSITDIFNHFNGKLKIKLQPKIEEEIFVSRERAAKFKEWLDGIV